MSSLAKLTQVRMDGTGQFTRTELTALLSELDRYIKQAKSDGRGGDALRLLWSMRECEYIENDDEAELVRRGIRLGLHLASFERKAYYRDVQARHRKLGQVTKAQNIESRNRQWVNDYNTMKPAMGCLKARQKIRDSSPDLSLRTITNVLENAGVYKKR